MPVPLNSDQQSTFSSFFNCAVWVKNVSLNLEAKLLDSDDKQNTKWYKPQDPLRCRVDQLWACLVWASSVFLGFAMHVCADIHGFHCCHCGKFPIFLACNMLQMMHA